RAWPVRAWAGPRAWGTASPAAGSWTCSAGCLRSRGGLPRKVLLEDAAGLAGIAVHLRDQGRQVGELLLVAQPRDELDLDPAPVQVAVEVEQVGLEQRFDAAHRGPGAEARHRRPGHVRHTADPGSVDPAQRRHLAAEAQVGGRIAERAAKLP